MTPEAMMQDGCISRMMVGCKPSDNRRSTGRALDVGLVGRDGDAHYAD
jgi:hypothetical protein